MFYNTKTFTLFILVLFIVKFYVGAFCRVRIDQYEKFIKRNVTDSMHKVLKRLSLKFDDEKNSVYRVIYVIILRLYQESTIEQISNFVYDYKLFFYFCATKSEQNFWIVY